MIAWKDIFKPRYALMVEIDYHITPPSPYESSSYEYYPVIRRLPYKRPWSMPFNKFYNTINKRGGLGTMVFCGSYLTFRNLYGIGSCEKHNMVNAIILQGPNKVPPDTLDVDFLEGLANMEHLPTIGDSNRS